MATVFANGSVYSGTVTLSKDGKSFCLKDCLPEGAQVHIMDETILRAAARKGQRNWDILETWIDPSIVPSKLTNEAVHKALKVAGLKHSIQQGRELRTLLVEILA